MPDRRRQTEILQNEDPALVSHLERGDRVGEYEIEALIGRGGMGIVYRAFQPVIERRVAVKVLTNSSAPRAVERFLQEARAVGRIKHRAIPDIHAFGTLPNGLQYYVMELLEGDDLRAVLRRGALEPAKAIHILKEVADGLQAAHQCGIVHRDLKPDNIFICTNAKAPFGAEVKLLDFGIAKLMESDSDPGPHASIGVVVGTPAYMPPEQLLGGAVTVRSDVYALACVAHEMLTGMRAFDPPTTGDLIRDKTMGKRRTLTETYPNLARFDHAIGIALSPDANSRYATPLDLVDALRESMDSDLSRVDTVPLVVPPRAMTFGNARSARIIIALSAVVAIGSLVLLLAPKLPAPPPIEAAPPPIAVEPAPEPPPQPPLMPPAAEPAPVKKVKTLRKPKQKKSLVEAQEDELHPEMPIRF